MGSIITSLNLNFKSLSGVWHWRPNSFIIVKLRNMQLTFPLLWDINYKNKKNSHPNFNWCLTLEKILLVSFYLIKCQFLLYFEIQSNFTPICHKYCLSKLLKEKLFTSSSLDTQHLKFVCSTVVWCHFVWSHKLDLQTFKPSTFDFDTIRFCSLG